MSVTFNDESTEQGLVQDLRFLSGQDNLSIEDATRLLNFAKGRYDHLAIEASGRWKYDDSTYSDRTKGETTFNSDNFSTGAIRLSTEHLVIDEVEVYNSQEDIWTAVSPVDASRDKDGKPLSEQYKTAGKPVAYDSQADEVQLYPAPSSTFTKLRVWYMRNSNQFAITDTTVAIGIPIQHQDYLSMYAALRLALRTNDANISGLRDAVSKKEREISDFYGFREMNTPRKLKGNIKNLIID